MNLFSSIPPIEDARVVAAITAAERRTSGEVRVFVTQKKTEEPVAAAQKQFERMGMTQTAARNGVLIFLAHVCRHRRQGRARKMRRYVLA